MGLLDVGAAPPLEWEASKQYIEHIKTEGLKQFLHIYNSKRPLHDNVLKWGDEVEYTIVEKGLDGTYRAKCDAPELLARLYEAEKTHMGGAQVTWHPEYSNWQIEGTPAGPYRCYVTDLLLVEPNMALRRSIVQKLCTKGTYCLSLTNFPVLGRPGYVVPSGPLRGPVAESRFLADDIINPHPRFAALTANIRRRRGRNVDIVVPLFEDANTAKTAAEATASGDPDAASVESGIRMDSMGFGMGACCLQVTLQARDVDEGRVLYDQLGVMGPIMLAVTAASPLWRGYLAATDVRWNVISQSVDCRTAGERGEVPLAEGEQPLNKSRYAGFSAYIAPLPGDEQPPKGGTPPPPPPPPRSDPTPAESPEPEPETEPKGLSLNFEDHPPGSPLARAASGGCTLGNKPAHLPEYDDVPPPVNQEVLDHLLANGIDFALARHVAWMYVRDPLVVYESNMQQDNTKDSNHFENIQSTNWNSVRFKLPPPGTDIGWRVEFRTMELQLTDFENAAFSIFTVLLSRIIIAFNMNLYIPMSKNDANMETAHANDAVTEEHFYFRKHCILPHVCAEGVELYHSTPGGGTGLRTQHTAVDFLHKRFPGVFKPCTQAKGFEDGAADGEMEMDVGMESPGSRESSDPNEYCLMTCHEIMNGKATGAADGAGFPGLIPLIHAYLDLIECDGGTRAVLNLYLELVSMRSSGELQTQAKWMREFVTNHPDYKHDSVLSESLHNALTEECIKVSNGTASPIKLQGTLRNRMLAVQASLAADPPGNDSKAPVPAGNGSGSEGAEELSSGVGVPISSSERASERSPLIGRSNSVGSDDGGAWDISANDRWHEILGRLSTEGGYDISLRGSSLTDGGPLSAMSAAMSDDE